MMVHVFDRLLKVSVFNRSDDNVAIATKAIAYLARIVVMIYDKFLVFPSANRTSGFGLKCQKLIMGQVVPMTQQVVGTTVCRQPTTAAFLAPNRGRGRVSLQENSAFSFSDFARSGYRSLPLFGSVVLGVVRGFRFFGPDVGHGFHSYGPA
jgi:hypothetical protein